MLRAIGKHALIMMAAAVLGLIAAFIGGFATAPFWGWFEEKTGIESLGHSGPADWVFELLFALAAITLFAWLEWMMRGRSQSNTSNAKDAE